MRTAFRGENRPAHRGKTIGKKGRVLLDDVMRRLEPRDIPFRARMLDFAEANERAHFMDVVPNCFLEIIGLRDVRIDRDLEQVSLAMSEPPEETIKEGPAARGAMERDQFGECEEAFRNVELR